MTKENGNGTNQQKASEGTDASSSSSLAYELIVTPSTQLQFVLERGHAAKCKLTLGHSGGGKDFIAYKVMTNQPRRYLVKPSHGVIAPDGTNSLTVSIVDKYKKELIQTFDRLGSVAANTQQDKFLVQSCVVSQEFAYAFEVHEASPSTSPNKKSNSSSKNGGNGPASNGGGDDDNNDDDDKKDLSGLFTKLFGGKKGGDNTTTTTTTTATDKDGKKKEPIVSKEELTALFKKVFSSKPTSGVPVTTKKLRAVHTVRSSPSGVLAAAAAAKGKSSAASNSMEANAYAKSLQNKSKEEVVADLLALKKRYDDLTEFTVTLTTERDALRRKLEHSRRK